MATYDCGSGSTVVISYPSPTRYDLSVNGSIVYIKPDEPFTMSCSGSLDVSGSSSSLSVLVIPLPDQGVFNDVFLLSLAGMLCGGLFAYVLNKYAV